MRKERKVRRWAAAVLAVLLAAQSTGISALADMDLLPRLLSKSDSLYEAETGSDAFYQESTGSDAAYQEATDSNAWKQRAVSGREVSVSTHKELIDAVYNAADGDKIILENDIDATSSASLRVTKDITVDGQGHTLDGKNQYGFFVIKSGGFLNLENTTVMNAKQNSKRASVIYTYGSKAGDGAALTNCTIINNQSSSAAIYISGGREFQMVNCTVADNPGTAVRLSDASALLANNIIVGNGTDITASNITDAGYNLVGSSSSGQFTSETSTVSGDLGKHTEWLTPASGYRKEDMGLPLLQTEENPAIDQIPEGNEYLPATDERGMDRPKNHWGDIGAYECEEYSAVTSLELGEASETNGVVTIPYTIGGDEGDSFNYAVNWNVTDENGDALPDLVMVTGTEDDNVFSAEMAYTGSKEITILSPKDITVKITAASKTNPEITAEMTVTVAEQKEKVAEALIDQIPARVMKSDKELVEQIRGQINLLCAEYGLSTDDVSNLTKLTDAEARLKQLEDQQSGIASEEELKDAIENAESGDTLYLGEDITLSGTSSRASAPKIPVFQFNITKDITIDGQGHTLDGDGQYNMFQINEAANLTLKNLTLKNACEAASKDVNVKYGSVASVISGGLSLENCIVTENVNTTNNYGYIICVEESQNLSIINSSIIGNTTKDKNYAAIYVGDGSKGVIANSILGENNNNYSSKYNYNYDIYFSSSGTKIVDGGYNRISGIANLKKSSAFTSATTEINSKYRTLSSWINENGKLNYTNDNPFIDQIPAGNSYLPETDILGVSRPQNAAGDIGAYEFEFAKVINLEIEGEDEITVNSGDPVEFSYTIGGEDEGAYEFSLNWSALYNSGMPLDEAVAVDGLGDDLHDVSKSEKSLTSSRILTFYAGKNVNLKLTVVSKANPELSKEFLIHVNGDPAALAEHLIETVPETDAITLEDRALIEKVRKEIDAYMKKYAISSDEISNYVRLTAAEAKIAELTEKLPDINTSGALIDAIMNAESGDTIYVTGDIELDAMSSASLKYKDSSKILTIEGNGHEINFNNKSGFMYIGINQITIRDLTFKNAKMSNYDGSVLSLRDNTKALIENCSFIGNRSAKKGGAIDVNSTSEAEFRNCTFVGNESGLYGGAIYQSGTGNLRLENCVFYDNSSWQYGGAVFSNDGSSDLEVVHCTFAGNSADESGSGVYLGSGGKTVLANSIFVGNENEFGEKNDIYLANSLDSVDGGYNLIGTTNAESAFAAEGTKVNAELGSYDSWMDDSMDEDYRVLTLKADAKSPAIDHIPYDNKWLNAEDHDGNTRPFNGKGDIGAYENVESVVTVDAITSASINEKTSSALQVKSGESFELKSAIRADRIHVDLSSDWMAADEDGNEISDEISVSGLEIPVSVKDGDDEMSRMEVREVSITSLKDCIVDLIMTSKANPEKSAKVRVSVTGSNFDKNNKDLADLVIQGTKSIDFRMDQEDAKSEDAIKEAIRQAIWKKFGTTFPMEIQKISYAEAAKGTIGNLAGTDGNYRFKVILSGGEGDNAYQTESEILSMVITASPYMTDANAENVMKLEVAAEKVRDAFAQMTVSSGLTKEEIAAKAKEKLAELGIDGVNAEITETGFAASDTANTGKYSFDVTLTAGNGASYAEKAVSNLTIMIEKKKAVPSGGNSGSGSSGGSSSGGSSSGGSSSGSGAKKMPKKETHMQAVTDNQAQWYKDGNEWKLHLTGGVHAVDRWVQKDGKWYWFDTNGVMAHGNWITYYDHWYYLNEDGSMKTGWISWNGTWYYLKADGSMAANETTPDGYQVGADGSWIR